jgi:predicted ribosome quality control (RQC) complex YloA/Tae2 family protein
LLSSSLIVEMLLSGGRNLLAVRAFAHVSTTRLVPSRQVATARTAQNLLERCSFVGAGRKRPSFPTLSTIDRFHHRPSHRPFSLLMTAFDDDDDDSTHQEKTLESSWNIPSLKKELTRLISRSHKKIGKASQKLRKAQETIDRLTDESSQASLEELEQCPDNMEALEFEMIELQTRLQGLNALDELLKAQPKKEAVVLPEETARLAIDLGVNDKPPPPPVRGPGKPKGPREEEKSRVPYRRYFSFQNIEIRVGKKAEDNDELSCSPLHRDGRDWWMHASGCPGSHVVIRSHDETLPEEVVQDAASMAALQSKCQGGVVKVSLTRCRDVKKPPGAKAGLVLLTGKVRTISVDRKEAERRFERLEKTVLIN